MSEGRTGHTEVVKVVYDSRIVSYRSICRVFWESHDPTDKIYLVLSSSSSSFSSFENTSMV